jgi:L-2,4-diaminobutyrate decarboxylase
MDILAQIEQDCTPEVARAFLEIATDYLAQTRDRDGRVSTDATPEALAARFAEPLPRAGKPVAEIVARLRRDVVPDSNHLYHPRYVGHQTSPPLPAAIWTESLIAALNQSVAVWEMSPVGTVIEHQVIRWLSDLVGYGPDAGGTVTTGGTEATFTALLAARSAILPQCWTDGVPERAPVIVCGDHVHYAVTRAAGMLGIGVRNVRMVPSRDFQMDVQALRAVLDDVRTDGREVLAVVATAGSTPTGAFDDLEAIGMLCADRGLWLHVDGAHGASALLSARHRHRLRGIERARSVAWDPHKMMLLPLQCGTVLVRDGRDLDLAFAQRAPYLFHDRESERQWDLGVRTLLCSRRADVLKLWVGLQRYGADGIGTLYERLCEIARDMYDAVEEHRSFEALHVPESNILCFRHIGAPGEAAACSRSGRPPDSTSLDSFNRTLRDRYNRSGAGWITSTVLDGQRVLRATVMNPRTSAADVHEVVAGLATVADDLLMAREGPPVL